MNDAHRIAKLEKAMKRLLNNYDPEAGAIDCTPDPGCPECTRDTTPYHLVRGPCAMHEAQAAVKP